MKRGDFISNSTKVLVGISLPLINVNAEQEKNIINIKTSTIKEFVKAGHNNLYKVKEMLSEIPNLIYARYDWGHGDFEEAVEGAGHTGDKEIANYLIEKGARVNLFVLTMLGKTDLVIPTLEEFPNLIFSKGPHGFSLLHHAKEGGEESLYLFNYLKEKGLNKLKFSI